MTTVAGLARRVAALRRRARPAICPICEGHPTIHCIRHGDHTRPAKAELAGAWTHCQCGRPISYVYLVNEYASEGAAIPVDSNRGPKKLLTLMLGTDM